MKNRGTAHESIVPYQAFNCKDSKQIVFMCANNANFKSLCTTILDMPHLVTDERFLTNGDRVKNRKVLIEILGEQFK